MKQTNGGRLRVHSEPAREALGNEEDSTSWSEMADLFAAATGWSFEVRSPVASTAAVSGRESEFEEPCRRWRLVPAEGARDGDGKQPPSAVAALARRIARDHDEREALYGALVQREAELATAVPLCRADDNTTHLSERLEWILRSVAESLGCDAGALYLLDDTTKSLKLRSAWGIPRRRLLEPPRSLRGAVADLEALMGSAVVLEDVRLAPFWRAPEGFAAALCLPIATDSTPLGTAWFFSRQPRAFGDAEVQLAEVGTGRIVAELERETLRHELRRSRDYAHQMHAGLVWQQDRLPQIELPVEGWSLDGWRNPAAWVGGSFYDWMMLPDGRALLAAGDVDSRGVEGALGGATLRGMVWSHAAIARSPVELLDRVHESWWLASPGGQSASLAVAVWEPETGRLDLAAAGAWHCLAGGKRAAWEMLDTPRLGDVIEPHWEARPTARFKRQHRLVLASADSIDRESVAAAAEQVAAPATASNWLDAFRNVLKEQGPPAADQLVVALIRAGKREA